MKINKVTEVPETVVEMEGAKDVSMQILIGLNEGSDNIIMRKFKVLPGGNTPHHSHDFEHIIKVENGKGIVVDENGNEHDLEPGLSAFVPANTSHQFKNPNNEPFEFLCIIPNPEKNKCCS